MVVVMVVYGGGEGGMVVVVVTPEQLKCPTTPPATERLPLPHKEGVREAIPLLPGVCWTSHC